MLWYFGIIFAILTNVVGIDFLNNTTVLVELNPIPTEETVEHFNELRQDIVLLYELKVALANCEYELQTLRHQYETIAPGRVCLSLYILNICNIMVLCVKVL